MGVGGVWWWLVMAVTLVQLSDNCKYPNLNMKFDIRKIVEPKTCTGLPTINGVMENITANLGDKVQFHCDVDYSCLVNSIRWYHTTPDNETTTQIKVGDRHVHTIHRVQEDDEGSYSCVAENVLGQTVITAYLDVNHSQMLSSSGAALLVPLLALGLAARRR